MNESRKNHDCLNELNSARYITKNTRMLMTIIMSAAAFPARETRGNSVTLTRLTLSATGISRKFKAIKNNPTLKPTPESGYESI
jgi:hypothetical protein